LFTPLDWSAALYMPPLHRGVRWAAMFERAGAMLWPGFAGVIIVEARKELMAPIGKTVSTLRTRELATTRSLSTLRAPLTAVGAGLEPAPLNLNGRTARQKKHGLLAE
jgi:hypothetical protein